MTAEKLANRLEVVLQNELENHTNVVVHKFTPSVIGGRRYIGVDIGDETFIIELSIDLVA